MDRIEKLREVVKEIEQMRNDYELKLKQLRDEIRTRDSIINNFRTAVQGIKKVDGLEDIENL